MDIVVWLRSLGLGKYEAAFREKGGSAMMSTSESNGRPPHAGITSRRSLFLASAFGNFAKSDRVVAASRRAQSR
jgi:hypothetical protein